MQYTINLSRTKTLSILLALSMLIGSIGWIQYSIATTTPSPPYTLNAPPTSAYDVYVGKYTNGTYYYEKGDWQTWYNTASASQAINYAIGNLTAGRTWTEKILLSGNFVVTTPIYITNNTDLCLNGVVTQADGSNCNLIQNLDQTTCDYNVIIEGGTWIGGTGALCWLNFTNTNNAPFPYTPITLQNLMILNNFKTAIYVNLPSQPVWINHVDATGYSGTAGYGQGLYLSGVTDSLITQSHFGSNVVTQDAIFIYGSGGMTSMTDIRTDGDIAFQGSSQLTLSGFTIDCVGRNVDGLTLYDCYSMTITGGDIRSMGNNGYNTKAAIALYCDNNNVIYNQISNIYCGRVYPFTDTNRWAYGVLESTAAGNAPAWNLYTNINANDTVNGNSLQVHSTISNSFN